MRQVCHILFTCLILHALYGWQQELGVFKIYIFVSVVVCLWICDEVSVYVFHLSSSLASLSAQDSDDEYEYNNQIKRTSTDEGNAESRC